jgi:hypothetical protein
MKTAVATKMPTCSPLATAAGSSGPTSGMNSCGLELAKKNRISGPISSTSLRMGLSFFRAGLADMRCM